MKTIDRNTRSLTMRALVLALAGLLSVLSGGLLILTGGPALSDPAGGVDTSTSLQGECVPTDAKTETTGWVIESPGTGWYEVDSRTVTDTAAYTESSGWVTVQPSGEGWKLVETRTVNGAVLEEGHWQRYSWRGGPLDAKPDVVPPHPDWRDNVAGDPHGVGKEGAYDRSNEHSGKSDWFYLEWVEPIYEQVTENRYERDVAAITHLEYRFAFDHPKVVCPTEPTNPTNPTNPTVPTDPTVPSVETTTPTVPVVPSEEASEPEVQGEQASDPTEPAVPDEEASDPTEAPDVEVLGEQATRPTRTVPKAVDAGASSWTSAQVLGTGLAGGGALLLVAAAGALMGARRSEEA